MCAFERESTMRIFILSISICLQNIRSDFSSVCLCFYVIKYMNIFKAENHFSFQNAVSIPSSKISNII